MKAKLTTVLLAGLIIGLSNVPAASAQNDVAVVVNSNNGTSSVTMGELRKIFNGEKRSWPGGASIKLLVRTAGTHERTAMLNLVGKSESEYKQYWTSQIYKGEATSEPIALPSNGMQKEALGVYPGAIALVDAAEVKPGMKVLKVDGHTPGDGNYPLHY
jgi:ABC-type phosphate transport system substrate-binding protein